MSLCKYCKQEIIEIGRFGESLVGCYNCNRWTWPSVSESISVALPEEDIWALKVVRASARLREAVGSLSHPAEQVKLVA